MVRRIIHIDEEKCNGCGACANACHESAIGMVNGKAKLLRDDSATVLVIVCQPVRPMRSHLLSVKQQRTMRQLFWQTKQKKMQRTRNQQELPHRHMHRWLADARAHGCVC